MVRGFVIYIAVVLWGIGGAATSYARMDVVPGSRYISGDGAAMADAYLPFAEDGASALFYNPAAIARIRQPHLQAVNLSVYTNSDYFSMINRNAYHVASLSSFAPEVGAKPTLMPGVGVSLFPNFSMRYLTFGILAQSEMISQAAAGNQIWYRSNYQFIPTIGIGVRLASGIVRLGYSLQYVNQASGEVTESMAADPLGYNQKLKQGSGLSHNIGFALTLPMQYLPSFHLVARNVMGLKFNASTLMPLARNSSGTLADEPMSIDTAVGIQNKLGSGVNINYSVEYRDMTNQSHISLFTRMATGLEIDIKDTVFIRGGWGSGYPQAGIGMRRTRGEINLSWTSEELGTKYRDKRNTKYMLQYQVNAF